MAISNISAKITSVPLNDPPLGSQQKGTDVNYPFDDPATPSLADMIAKLASDRNVPPRKRDIWLPRLRQVARWIEQAEVDLIGQTASEVPFTQSHIEALAKSLSPARCGTVRSGKESWRSVAQTTIDTAISACRSVLRHYGLPRRTWAPLSPCWDSLSRRVNCKYQGMELRRLFCFLSSEGVTPSTVRQVLWPPF